MKKREKKNIYINIQKNMCYVPHMCRMRACGNITVRKRECERMKRDSLFLIFDFFVRREDSLSAATKKMKDDGKLE